ncbi:sialate O-acetylesterase [Sunxiuqinia sp. A32]|uniref:sialate O-acetylesterase n=1 Tax=Sunxiuqinia sp. A32 TaxID=3461496 RepID=UPI00404663AC
MKKLFVLLGGILLLLFASNDGVAAVKLPAIISDNMVLQGGMKSPVWGWASAGETVEIEFNGKQYKTVADAKGNWSLKLKSLKSGGPYEMKVKGQDNTIIIKNILVGEVWLASGQSNMEFGIQTEAEGEQAIKNATDSMIRFFWVPFAKSLEEQKDIPPVSEGSLNGKWVVCSPETMAANWAWHGFSAVGYYFALEIRKSSGKAVGMIGSYKGGTEAQPWISQSGFDLEPALPAYKEKHKELVEQVKKSAKEADFRGPSNAYNAMIAPICPFGIRGVIWYQGESNGDNLDEAVEYLDIFPRLIRNWRNLWDEGDFPFLYVQLPNFKKVAETPSEGNWAWVREAQLKTLALPNTGMAVTIDCGDAEDIHPKAKKEVGRRLSLIANHMIYEKSVDSQGPMLKSQKIEDNKIALIFKSTGGLKEGKLTGFGIAGEDGNFVWADAFSDGKQVIVSSPQVANPVAVRYNWGDNPQGNLYGKNGLPPSPFRTDTFNSK